MLPYVILNFIIIILAYLLHEEKAINCRFLIGERSVCISNKRLFIIFSSVVLILFMGLRNDITSDYNAYISIFKNNASQSLVDLITKEKYPEIGFRLFNKAFGCITRNEHVYMLVITAIYIFFIMKGADKQVTNIYIYTILFVNVGIYFQSFNLVRQALAASIIYTGVGYLQEGKYKKYILIVLFASTIHTTSLFMLAAVPFMRRKVNTGYVLSMMAFAVVSFIFLDTIIALVQRFKYAGYVWGMSATETIKGVIVQWCVIAFSVFITFLYKVDVNTPTNRIIINGSIFFVITSVLSFKVYQMSRLTYFFSPYILAWGTNSLELVTREKKLVFVRYIVVGLCILYTVVWMWDSGFANYSFFWRG